MKNNFILIKKEVRTWFINKNGAIYFVLLQNEVKLYKRGHFQPRFNKKRGGTELYECCTQWCLHM